jgi:hypothetical protein
LGPPGQPPFLCDGGLLVFDPNSPAGPQCNAAVLASSQGQVCQLGAFNPTTYTGVISLRSANRAGLSLLTNQVGIGCSPNGITVGPNTNLMLGCSPGNNGADTTTQVINAARQGVISPTDQASSFADVSNITGSDEVWYNSGDGRYYLGASKSYTKTPVCTPVMDPTAPKFCAVLGVVDQSSVLIETIPQSTGSHSVAADSVRNTVWVPQVAPDSVVGPGGDTTTVGHDLCGGDNGCVVVYGSPGLPPPGSFVVEE